MASCSKPDLTKKIPEHLRTLPQVCPRAECGSSNVKFRYCNNNKLDQPRFVCKTCKQFFTLGGKLHKEGAPYSKPDLTKILEHLSHVRQVCPRVECGSSIVEFKYVNNMKPDQPRFLCKACKQSFTLGGKLYLREEPKPNEPSITKSSGIVIANARTSRPVPSLAECVGIRESREPLRWATTRQRSPRPPSVAGAPNEDGNEDGNEDENGDENEEDENGDENEEDEDGDENEEDEDGDDSEEDEDGDENEEDENGDENEEDEDGDENEEDEDGVENQEDENGDENQVDENGDESKDENGDENHDENGDENKDEDEDEGKDERKDKYQKKDEDDEEPDKRSGRIRVNYNIVEVTKPARRSSRGIPAGTAA